MPVRILQPGDKRGTVKIENLGIGPPHPHHIVIGSDANDPLAAHRHGLSRPVCRVRGVNRSIPDDERGRRLLGADAQADHPN